MLEVTILTITLIQNDHLCGRAECRLGGPSSIKIFPQINQLVRQVHLVAWDDKRNLVLDQPFKALPEAHKGPYG